MKRITLHRHPDCVRCGKMARVHGVFDWLGRVECTTAEPKTGPLKLGEIAVEDVRTGRIIRGIHAVRAVARNIPAYWPLLPLLYVPPIARRMDAEVRGCEDGKCGLPEVASAPESSLRA